MTAIALDERNASIWESNLSRLKELQPRLAARLERWVGENGCRFEHEETPTPKGIWVSGLTAEPFFQSNELPQKPCGKGEENRVPVLFLYGLGTEPWFSRIVGSLPTSALAVVALEPNISLLAMLLHTTDVYGVLPKGCRISFIVEPHEWAVEEALAVNVTQMGTYAASLARPWAHPGEFETFGPRFAELQKALHERFVTKLQELGNSAEDTLLGLRQIALASPWIALTPSLTTIAETYKGRPFIWVASGPSLDNNVHLLKENEDRAVLICADTVAFKLLGLGIVPHIVVALERGVPVYEYLEKIWISYPEEAERILLVSQAVCVPEVAGKWPGPKAVVGKREIPVDAWMIGEVLKGDVMYSGLSVAHMGVWLAAYLGASSLALLGQDLAYGEGRRTHAGDTVNAHAIAVESTARGGLFSVPAALGGTVTTHSIWLLFLRLLERYIPMLNVPVFDCSEGGALIQGTTVMPLADWMEQKLSGVKTFDKTPAAAFAERMKGPEERLAAVRSVIESSRNGFALIAESRKKLDELEAGLERVAAPALSPMQRRLRAEELSRLLDAFHRSNSVVEFVGQSLLTLNAAGIIENRFLEDVPAVERWKNLHMEILEGHRTTLNFMENWLTYLAAAVRIVNDHWDKGYALSRPLPFFFEDSAEADSENLEKIEKAVMVRPALELIARLQDAESGEQELETHVLLDSLIARADHKWWNLWDRRIDWKVALVLAEEGRNAEAVTFLKRMEKKSMEVHGLAQDAAVAFFKNCGRIYSSYDMCYNPDFDMARLFLQNALDLEPDDVESAEILREINLQAMRHFMNLSSVVVIDPKAMSRDAVIVQWKLDQTRAEQAMAEGDLSKALAVAWEMVRRYLVVLPEGVSDYLEWLTTQIARIEEEFGLPAEIVRIKSEVTAWLPMFGKVGMKIAPAFLGEPEGRLELEAVEGN